MRDFGVGRIRGIFWDYDDLAAPTEETALAVSYAILSERGLFGDNPMELEDFFDEYAGKTFGGAVETISRERGIAVSEEEVQGLVLYERQRVIEAFKEGLTPSLGMNELLARIQKEAGVKQAIVSTSTIERLEVCLEATGQDQFIPKEHVFSAQSSLNPPKPKPDPAVYIHAMESIGVDPKFAVAVEDSPSGMTAASGAEIRLLVGYTGALKPALREKRAKKLLHIGAHLVIDDLNNMNQVLDIALTSSSERSERLNQLFKECGPYWVSDLP